MRAVVVYESMFGHTRRVAEAIGSGLASAGVDVQVSPTDEVDAASLDADLLVVGAPTHLRGLSTLPTRKLARYSTNHPPSPAVPETSIGVRQWMRRCAEGAGRDAAAFDTAVDDPAAGSAAVAIAERLRGRSWNLLVPPESFHVFGVDGGFRVLELTRAKTWGASLAEVRSEPAAVPPTT